MCWSRSRWQWGIRGMGAGGTVTVGEREREAVASGAQANFADQEAGAGATDGVNYGGTTYANAMTTTAEIFSQARGLLNDAKIYLEHSKVNLEEAQWNKAQAQNDQQRSQHNIWDKNAHLSKASEAVEVAGKKKMDLLNSKTNMQMNRDGEKGHKQRVRLKHQM